MPNAKQFLAGFGLVTGTEIGGYKILSAESSHITINRYQEYRYDIVIKFINLGNGTFENLYRLMIEQISQQPIIYGIKNPYKCIIDLPSEQSITQSYDGTLTWKLLGHSYRAN